MEQPQTHRTASPVAEASGSNPDGRIFTEETEADRSKTVARSRLDEIRERLSAYDSWHPAAVPLLTRNAPADLAWACAEIERLTAERDINTDFHKEMVRDFEAALGPHPRWDNGMYIERIREIVAERDALKADKARLVALLSRARPDVREEGSREDVLDCAIVEEIDQARKEPA